MIQELDLSSNLNSKFKNPTGKFKNSEGNPNFLKDSWLSGVIEKQGLFTISKIKNRIKIEFILTLEKENESLMDQLKEKSI